MKFRNAILTGAAVIAMTGAAIAQDTRQTVSGAISEVFVEKNVAAIDGYFAEPYIQHNQSVPTGLEAFRGLATAAIAENPGFNYQLIRFFIDGDIAIAHGIYQGFGDVALVGFDLFRVENGKIVEHWDNLAPVAASNPSGRSQTDGSVQVTDLASSESNKALVGAFYDAVLIGGQFDRIGAFFDGDSYLQHNSKIADGLSGLGAGLQTMADAGITMRITRRHALYGEGNFVLVLAEGEVAGQRSAFYDLFRVQDGKIAEHWDVISTIIPDSEAANSNGKF